MTNIMKRKNAQPATFGSVVDQIFHNSLMPFIEDDFRWLSENSGSNGIPLNIRENEKSYEIELVAPGVKKQDFQIQVVADTLTVSLEIKDEHNEQNNQEGWLRKEYKKQSFSRSFRLDDTVDARNISAKYEDGVLFISLPKKEHAQKVSRTIDIQ